MMKRFRWLVPALVLLIPLAVYSADVFSVMGDAESKDYTFSSDAAVTVRAAFEAGGGTWLQNGDPPKAFTLQAETNTMRVAFLQTPSVDNVGVLISALGSIRYSGRKNAENAKICNGTAGSNAKVHIIVER